MYIGCCAVLIESCLCVAGSTAAVAAAAVAACDTE